MGKIKSTAKLAGIQVIFVDSYEHLIESIEDRKPDAVIVDLNGPLTLAHLEHIRSSHDVRIIGYLTHSQTDLKKKAEKVCEVMTQGEFSNNLVQILS